jgi:hypothetical protein
MRGLLAVAVTLTSAITVSAQEQDRSLERMAIALQQPSSVVIGPPTGPDDSPKALGPLTLVQPVLRGEMIRMSVPLGEYVSHASRAIATANRKRKEAAIRRRIEAELKLLGETKK